MRKHRPLADERPHNKVNTEHVFFFLTSSFVRIKGSRRRYYFLSDKVGRVGILKDEKNYFNNKSFHSREHQRDIKSLILYSTAL